MVRELMAALEQRNAFHPSLERARALLARLDEKETP